MMRGFGVAIGVEQITIGNPLMITLIGVISATEAMRSSTLAKVLIEATMGLTDCLFLSVDGYY